MRLVLARVVTRREAEPIARDRGRVLHEQHHHLLAPLQHRQVERRVALSVGGVDLGLVLDELQRGLLEAVARAQVERRLAARVSGAHVRARGDECSGRHRPSCWAALTSAPLAMSQGSSLLSGAVACIARAWCSVLRPTASTSSSCTFVGASSPAAATPPPAVAEAEAAAASLVGHRGRHDAAPVVAAEAAAVPTLPTALRRASSSEASRSCRCDCAASSAGVTACPSGAVVEASRWSSAATACGARARTARWLVAKSGRVSDRTAGTNARPQRRFWRQCGERPSLGPRAQP
eukprot:scaffold6851_cov57-Phaeocystis_antarctica.AAC.1